MTEPLSSRFPEPLDNDDDDVAWALQTAKVMWQRGARADAIVWLRRAADTADQQSNVWRAADLRRAADELTAAISTRPAFSRPPPVSSSRRGGGDIDDLLGSVGDQPLPSFAPADEVELEVEPESFDEIVIEDTETRIELISEVDEAEVIDDEEVDEEIEAESLDDEIDDDALAPLPSFPIEPSTDPGLAPYSEADEPVTQ